MKLLSKLFLVLLVSVSATAAEGLKTLVVSVPTLVDAQGRALYIFDSDINGIPSCYDQCEKAWPPLLVSSASARLQRAPIGSVARKNGQLQVTLNGKPLYYFFQDLKQGDIKGDGLGGVWHLVTTPGQIDARRLRR